MVEYVESVLERLCAVNPETEVWWDSSPLVFEQWVQKMVKEAPENKKAVLESQLRRIYVADDPAKSLIHGCTTNPPLSLAAVKSDPEFWAKWVDGKIHENPGIDAKALFWMTYKEVVRRGAEMLLPIWEKSNGRMGYISGQLDPRLFTEVDIMVRDAQEIRAIAPNVMIKVPASTQGVEVVKILTSMAIPTNVTTCFTLPQIWAVANAAKEGYALGVKNGVDKSKWRAVITHMMGRLTESSELDKQAERRGISLSWADKHWLGIYVFRKAYKLLKENAYPSKMLLCSMRDGPLVAGKYKFWDVEKLAGGAIVYTMPPYVLDPLFKFCDDMVFENEIEKDDVPGDTMKKLSKIPYVLQSWDENGMEIDQFNIHPATIDTVKKFSEASSGLENFCADRIKAVTGAAVMSKN
jgi:transaldolase